MDTRLLDGPVKQGHDKLGCYEVDCVSAIRSGGGADADEAFFVVHHACAAITYSIAHEVGHILGTRHDRFMDANDNPYPFAHDRRTIASESAAALTVALVEAIDRLNGVADRISATADLGAKSEAA